MDHTRLILLFLIASSFFGGANALECGDRQIENCKECGKGNQSDTCAVCEDNYFPLLYNLFCFACDDPLYGQEGCKGQCTYNLDLNNSLYVHCQNCKEGYYNKNGVCYKCDLNIAGCSECSYSSEKDELKCLKCSTEEGYRFNQSSNCVKCNDLLYNCKKCHFVGNEGLEECDECLDGFYLNSNKKCFDCYYLEVDGAYCYTCKEDQSDVKPENCYCDSGYVLNGFSCMKCPNYCDKCEINKTTGKTECLRCNANYFLNNEKQCNWCDLTNCNYCDLDENDKKICLDCNLKKYIPEEKQCLSLSYCSDYVYDDTNKSTVCIECSSDSYILDPATHQCKSKNSFNPSPSICEKFEYDYSIKTFVCKSCATLRQYIRTSYYYWHNYTYINNTFQCLSNRGIGFYGCEFAEYNNESNHYECLQCLNYEYEHYIKVNADKSCIEASVAKLSFNCLEAERNGEQYSCIKCDVNDTIVLDTSTNLKNCYKREEKLSLCLEGKLENGNLICIKCVDNAILKDNICSCNSDSFSKDNITSCFKCNDAKEGNPACDESEGCKYSSSNEKITCKKCGEGYYEKSEGQCSLCSYSIRKSLFIK